MPMQMGWRWYGEGNDKISLSEMVASKDISVQMMDVISGMKNREIASIY